MRGVPWLGESDTVARAALADLAARAEQPPGDIWTEVGLAAVLRRAAPGGDDQRLAWCTRRDPERPDGR